jgi:hypothetical protein
VPIFYPLVLSLDFGSTWLASDAAVTIWFGILVVVVTEISLISPPHWIECLRSALCPTRRADHDNFSRCVAVLGSGFGPIGSINCLTGRVVGFCLKGGGRLAIEIRMIVRRVGNSGLILLKNSNTGRSMQNFRNNILNF